MTIETKKTYCRICTAYCGIEVDVDLDGNRIAAVRGDASDPVTGGYTCIKGRQLAHQQAGPARLRGSLRRSPDGGFDAIASDQAISEVGDRLAEILERHGPRAIASFSGTAAYSNSGLMPLVRAWQRSFGSHSNYSTLTIDQPGKMFAVARQGVWGAGGHTFDSADVIMTIGNNPIISGLTLPGGPPGVNPVKSLESAIRRGLQVICVDPRRSETARRAAMHLQIRPGEDATLLAGMLRLILEEKLQDQAFCDEWVEGLTELEAAVADFPLDYVARRTTIPRDQIVAATRLFAAGPRGYVSSGTGPDMGPHPGLTQMLISNLNAVCGRFHREGERLPNPGLFSPPIPRPAQVIAPEFLPPGLQFGKGPTARFRGLGQMFEEMPSTTLADEILEPGDGQIRALVCIGSNPAVAVPDSRKMARALDSLELLVSIDINMTETTKRADYVIAARHSLEREDVTDFMDLFYEEPYAHYTKAVLEPDFDVVEDWTPLLAWAARLGGTITLPGGEVPLDAPLSKLALLERVHPGMRVPLAEMRERNGGHVYEEIEVHAAPPIPGMEARLQLMPDDTAEELAAVRAEDFEAQRSGRFSHLLICRRIRNVSNSVGHDFPETQAKTPANHAYMNGDELAGLGLEEGDLIEIESERDTIFGVVSPTDEVRPGVISMAHCWGRPDEDGDVRKDGSNTARLLTTEGEYDRLSGMVRMTAIPVAVRPAEPGC